MTQAFKRVVANGGASGIDGMKASELQSYLNGAWEFLKADILTGKYEPSAVRRVEIPKPNGGVRLLGIPTVLDRLLQQAIAQELQVLWEATFSDHHLCTSVPSLTLDVRSDSGESRNCGSQTPSLRSAQ